MIVIENLNFFSFIKLINFLFFNKINLVNNQIHYVDHSKYLIFYRLFIESFFSKKIIQLNFKYDDLKDENGVNYGFYKLEIDIANLFKTFAIKNHLENYGIPVFERNFVAGYIIKNMLQDKIYGLNSLRKFLLMLNAILNFYKTNNFTNQQIYFFVEKRLWIEKLSSHAKQFNINLFQSDNIILNFIHLITDYIIDNKYILLCKSYLENIKTGDYYFFVNRKLKPTGTNPKIIIEQIFQIFNPNSFWSFSIPPSQILFVSKQHKINSKELNEIRKLGMNFLSLSSRVSSGIDTNFYRPDNEVNLFRKYSNNNTNINTFSIEQRKISLIKNKFYRRREYWRRLFKNTNTKIYISHDRWNSDHIAASYAAKDIGGISATWQTSFYEIPTLHSSVYSDILFSFSNQIKNVEIKMQSELKYIVCTGFPYDHYFKDKIESGKLIREKLIKKGAKKIICILDGGAKIDERWSVGVSNYRDDYKFWLKKLLDQEWLGLVIKSKGPGTLHKRLGPVSELLSKAIDTGRCFFSDIYNYGDKNLDFRVAEAALGSDICVHFCLYAGTAGLEAKLAGIPTLIFDRFGLTHSRLYKLGKDKIVFNNWEKMWNLIIECLDQQKNKQIDDWSIINEIDPFRDGMAAYRINNFLSHLLEGFKKGLKNDEILIETTEKYASKWGEEKIISFN